MPPRKRVRKRKRRNASSSSESDSDSSESSSSENEQKKVQITEQPVIPAKKSVEDTSSDSDSDSSSSSGSSASPSKKTTEINQKPSTETSKAPIHRPPVQPPSRSPTPPSGEIPSILPPSTADVPSEKEKKLKEKFKMFWMNSVTDAFKDDLEVIRKESNMTTSRLSLLIDSLASGADVFSSAMPNGETAVDEMEVVLGST